MKNVVLLGSTGSIGTSTAKVAEDLPEDIRLVGLAAGGNDALLAEQAKEFKPELISISSPEKAEGLSSQLDGIRVASGEEGLIVGHTAKRGHCADRHRRHCRIAAGTRCD